MSASTVSFHLKELDHAGSDPGAARGPVDHLQRGLPGALGLIAFLMRDCCQGRPEVCTPAVASLSSCCNSLTEAVMPETFDVVIYHNPDCGTSRNTLAMIRNTGIEPHVIEYLKTPPNGRWSSSSWPAPASRCGRCCGRRARPTRAGPGRSGVTDEQLLDAIEAHPILMNRPLCEPQGRAPVRPSEAVLDLLPAQQGEFREGGWGARGRRAQRRVATA